MKEGLATPLRTMHRRWNALARANGTSRHVSGWGRRLASLSILNGGFLLSQVGSRTLGSLIDMCLKEGDTHREYGIKAKEAVWISRH